MKPLVPEDRRTRPSDTIVRSIVAKANTILGVKAATAPAMTTITGWAQELALTSTADLIIGDVGMGPVTAARELFRRSIQLKFGRSASVIVPTIVTAATGIGFVGENQPIPVKQFLFQGPRLTPHKMAFGVAISNEMYLTANAETYIRLAMSEALAADLEIRVFDTNPASAIRPAGLRSGVAGLTPTAGGGEAALDTDITALVMAIKPVAGSEIVLVCSPDTYLKMATRPNPNFPYPILETSGLPAKTVLAAATRAVAVVTVLPVRPAGSRPPQ